MFSFKPKIRKIGALLRKDRIVIIGYWSCIFADDNGNYNPKTKTHELKKTGWGIKQISETTLFIILFDDIVDYGIPTIKFIHKNAKIKITRKIAEDIKEEIKNAYKKHN